MKEKDLYPPMTLWLKNLLKSHYSNKDVKTYDTSQIYLSNFIREKGWTKLCPEYAAYQLKIDILGILIENNKMELVLVEVKNTKISLKDISQLIGYTRVVKPLHSMILSPKWISDPVKILFESYKRYDILKYGDNMEIKVCLWDIDKNDIDYNKIYPGKPLLGYIH